MPHAWKQLLVLTLCAAVLVALLGQGNHALAPLGLTLTMPGLLISYAALRLPLGTGLAAALLAGLLIDSQTPVEFGRHAAILGLAFCLVHRVRGRLPREETVVAVVAALFVNLGIFVLLAFLDLGGLPDPAAGALRLLADLLVSQLATALVGPWFVALQRHSLQLAGAAPQHATSRFA
ncbi:MAG: hypothetical protein MUE42_04890 [Opitutaceae bacterium]|jgi:rod shape-determining protein MreD|nr:hypothetical protein [Opitutaceae bacterium]